jgi:tRNA threonylcarbamoyladenosine dehydratase
MDAPARAEFLDELTSRNRGLIAEDDRRRLAGATFLIAGCGSTGGAAVEPLVRAGAGRLILAEPGSYELSNLNRQRASIAAIGRNKAEWLAEQAKAINPYLDIEVHPSGVSATNAAGLVAGADLVVDAVDVTSMEGLSAKFALHEEAARARRPTVSAYDLAYRQYVRVYDYRARPDPLAGRLEAVRRAANPVDALAHLVPFWAVPLDLVGEIDRLLDEPGASIGQLGCASDLFGALLIPLTIELLAGRRVRRSFTVDLKDVALPGSRRLARRVLALAGLLLARLRRRDTP